MFAAQADDDEAPALLVLVLVPGAAMRTGRASFARDVAPLSAGGHLADLSRELRLERVSLSLPCQGPFARVVVVRSNRRVPRPLGVRRRGDTDTDTLSAL